VLFRLKTIFFNKNPDRICKEISMIENISCNDFNYSGKKNEDFTHALTMQNMVMGNTGKGATNSGSSSSPAAGESANSAIFSSDDHSLAAILNSPLELQQELINSLQMPEAISSLLQYADNDNNFKIILGGKYATLTSRRDAYQQLLDAAKSGDFIVVRELRDSGLDLTGKAGGEALMIAAKNGHDLIIQKLYVDGLDMNGPAAQKALIMAAENGHDRFVYTLGEYGLDTTGQAGADALRIATEKGHADVVKRLKSAQENWLENQ
jgi:ankyrin repeat protein